MNKFNPSSNFGAISEKALDNFKNFCSDDKNAEIFN